MDFMKFGMVTFKKYLNLRTKFHLLLSGSGWELFDPSVILKRLSRIKWALCIPGITGSAIVVAVCVTYTALRTCSLTLALCNH
jgi:hypothetical protein